MVRLSLVTVLLLVPSALWATQPLPSRGPDGVLVMAHGGDSLWNASVGEALAPVRALYPTALAFGMADPSTMQAALDSLAAQGVERVSVVRMFLSGASFRHQTEYLLGLRTDPPAEPMLMGHGGHAGGMDGSMALQPLRHDMEIVMSDQGLMESWVSAEILAARAAEMGGDVATESVLLLAHGMGDEAENDRVLAEMERAAAAIRALGFRDVKTFTLREDWEDARVVAEEAIRSAMAAWRDRGDRVLVLPFRLSGFGPYAEVLEGFPYEAGQGLIPHPLVGTWVERTARALLNPGAVEG